MRSTTTRLTLARAGRTRGVIVSCLLCSAHPRSCGADGLVVVGAGADGGSSPLVRGGRWLWVAERVSGRLIPARAGRTVALGCRAGVRAAHPRSCGADSAMSRMVSRMPGSSPLVRGGLGDVADGVSHARLIPARAGRTIGRPTRQIRPRAHPRSCGADALGRLSVGRAYGSSPLVRGGLTLAGRLPSALRLIPARAGRTRRQGASGRWSAAHPRSCGADRFSAASAAFKPGSSPLVRGGQDLDQEVEVGGRLIPARAGRTGRCSARYG